MQWLQQSERRAFSEWGPRFLHKWDNIISDSLPRLVKIKSEHPNIFIPILITDIYRRMMNSNPKKDLVKFQDSTCLSQDNLILN